MIKFLKLYVGNENEAFIENHLSDGVNIIYSDDNNKGKTIITQGLYYALGNTPIFPSKFDYENYYFIVEISSGTEIFSICRKNKTVLFWDKKILTIFDSVSEFKRFFDKKIYRLPRIIKDDREKITDLDLFYQLFFVGQDKRDTSKIFNSGYNNKDDFMNMVYSYAGCSKINSNVDIEYINRKKKELKNEREILLKKESFLKQYSSSANFITYTADKSSYIKKLKEAETLNNNLIKLRNERNRIQNRKLKNEALIGELRSLNRKLSEGSLVCLDCHGQRIGYETSNKDINFDVSDAEIRSNVLLSIQNRIDSANEDLEIINQKILNAQKELKELLKDENVSIENLIIFKNDIVSSQSVDERICQIDKDLDKYEYLLKIEKDKNTLNTISRETLLNGLFNEMNSFYKTLEPTGKFEFDNLFSKKDVNYSGSEECEFYLIKLYALAKILKHEFPIVMDAFREGELSTIKENIVLDYFKKLPNQTIFTATLKDQELGKYQKLHDINSIDYSKNKTHQILNTKDVNELLHKLSEFSIKLSPGPYFD